jgi:hypothetical protein
MRKSLLIIIWSILMQLSGAAQSKIVMENYHYSGYEMRGLFVPVLSFCTGRNGYAELRYNYDGINTFSGLVGKVWTLGRSANLGLSPLLGYSIGSSQALLIGTHTDWEGKKSWLSLRNEFSIPVKGDAGCSFFSWAEAAYSIYPNFFTGISVQYFRGTGENKLEPALFGGFQAGNFLLPVYYFNPFGNRSWWVVGINYEWVIKKRKARVNKF